ncbi:MAG: TIGR01212 family radical SAM protein, partial [Bacteroidales bacterium]|nr:TIGR01212 family radical SAM protein [Bacteroidales bacterium]
TSYLAYFQAFSNTYADLEHLQKLYEEALSVPEVRGIVVGTRPDCVDEVKLDYFAELSKRCHLVLEYGMESMLNNTLLRVNRGHDVEKSRWAVEETARRGIHVGGHLIIGLPGEKRSDFLDMAMELADWPLDTVKFHQLQLIKGTAMAREFEKNPVDFPSFAMEDYLELMMEIVELLPPRLVIERIAGEVIPGMGLREGWGIRYDGVLKVFEKLLEENDSWQGKKFIART